MLTDGNGSDGDVTRQFLVECEACSLERTTEGRGKATQIAHDHRQETGHDVVVLELPASGPTA